MQAKLILKVAYQEQEGGPSVIYDPTPRPVVEYETWHKGTLGIEDGEGSGFEFDIPTDDVCEIKLLVLHNLTGDEVNIEFNGGDDFTMEAGDVWGLTMNSNDRDSPVYSVTGYTVNNQVGAGGLGYFVAGDTW